MESPALVGAGPSSLSPTSPVSVRSYGGGANGGPKRKRSTGGPMSAIDSSPGSMGEDHDTPDHLDKKRQSGIKRERQPGVKRACNDVSSLTPEPIHQVQCACPLVRFLRLLGMFLFCLV
jgi:hypothetical protein